MVDIIIPDRFAASLRDRCRLLQRTVALPESQDARVLQAAALLCEYGSVAKVILWGEERGLVALARQNSIDLGKWRDRLTFIENDQQLVCSLTERHQEQLARKGQIITPAQLTAFAQSPLNQAGQLLHEGRVHAVVAGSVATTAEVIRAGLSTVGLLAGLKTVCGAFIMHRERLDGLAETYLYGDSAVVIEPTDAQLVDIAAALAHGFTAMGLGHEARVAFLSFSTKGSAKHPRQERMSRAAAAFKEKYPTLLADGELQFDAAYDAAVAARKCPGSPVAGRSNCFVFPDLDSGNIAYKVTQRLGGFAAYGPILLGLALPFSDLSRGASPEDIAVTAMINLLRA